MRCGFCGLVVSGESPTARERSAGYASCNGCWAAFVTAIKAGVEPADAQRQALKVHHDAEAVKLEAIQSKARAQLEADAEAHLEALAAEARK